MLHAILARFIFAKSHKSSVVVVLHPIYQGIN